jgi:hypothetical protein
MFMGKKCTRQKYFSPFVPAGIWRVALRDVRNYVIGVSVLEGKQIDKGLFGNKMCGKYFCLFLFPSPRLEDPTIG